MQANAVSSVLPGTLQVEVVNSASAVVSDARAKLDPGAEFVHGGVTGGPMLRQVIDVDSEQLARGISDISAVIGKAMQEASPDAWSVEFNVGFKAGLKVPVLLSGEANAALKVTLNWKNAGRGG